MDDPVYRITCTWIAGPGKGTVSTAYAENNREKERVCASFDSRFVKLDIIRTLGCVMRAELASQTKSGCRVTKAPAPKRGMDVHCPRPVLPPSAA